MSGTLSIMIQICYTIDMKHWESIQQCALGSNGIVTLAQAGDAGVFPAEIYRWCKAGKLLKVGRGVYRLTSIPLQGLVSDMASLLAMVGKDAYLYGESVLSLLGLCPTRPYIAYVAVPRRIRKTTLPKGVIIIRSPASYRPIYHDGIACQRPADAIRSCVGALEKSRLAEAVAEGERLGYFLRSESAELMHEVTNAKTAAQRT